MNRSLLLLLTIVLASCAPLKSIRQVNQLENIFLVENEKSVDLLIEGSQSPNRDIQTSSIFYLGEKIDSIKSYPKKYKIDDTKLVTLQNHLVEVFNKSKDFNVRNVCLDAITKFENEEAFLFLNKTLARDFSIGTQKLILINMLELGDDKPERMATVVEAFVNSINKNSYPNNINLIKIYLSKTSDLSLLEKIDKKILSDLEKKIISELKAI